MSSLSYECKTKKKCIGFFHQEQNCNDNKTVVQLDV